MQTEYEQAREKWRRATSEHALHLERCAASLAAYNARNGHGPDPPPDSAPSPDPAPPKIQRQIQRHYHYI